jgi:hypothetical protein
VWCLPASRSGWFGLASGRRQSAHFLPLPLPAFSVGYTRPLQTEGTSTSSRRHRGQLADEISAVSLHPEVEGGRKCEGAGCRPRRMPAGDSTRGATVVRLAATLTCVRCTCSQNGHAAIWTPLGSADKLDPEPVDWRAPTRGPMLSPLAFLRTLRPSPPCPAQRPCLAWMLVPNSFL